MAYVAQKNEMSRVTVFDCVLLGRKPYFGWTAGDEDLERCADMIRRTGLSHLQLRSLDTLSGGELQKAMLARALVQEPRVLLLDEPTSSLDPSSQYGMMELVRQITKERGLTSLIVLHDLNLALRFCDRFLFLREGRAFLLRRAGGGDRGDYRIGVRDPRARGGAGRAARGGDRVRQTAEGRTL